MKRGRSNTGGANLLHHVKDTGRLFKWRRRFNTYVLEVRPEGRWSGTTSAGWVKHNVVLDGRDAYFTYLRGGRSEKTYIEMDERSYSALMRAILLGGLQDGAET